MHRRFDCYGPSACYRSIHLPSKSFEIQYFWLTHKFKASNPKTFEEPKLIGPDTTWQRASDTLHYEGPVAIGTDKSINGAQLTVHGNIVSTGQHTRPSDRRVKEASSFLLNVNYFLYFRTLLILIHRKHLNAWPRFALSTTRTNPKWPNNGAWPKKKDTKLVWLHKNWPR